MVGVLGGEKRAAFNPLLGLGRASKLALPSTCVDLVAEYSKQTEQIKRVQKLADMAPVEPSERPQAAMARAYKASVRLTAKQRSALVRDYEAGATGGELAKRYDLARSTVIKILKQEGARVRRPRVSAEDTALAVELYRQGMRQVDIAEQLGRDKSLIWHLLNRAGVL